MHSHPRRRLPADRFPKLEREKDIYEMMRKTILGDKLMLTKAEQCSTPLQMCICFFRRHTDGQEAGGSSKYLRESTGESLHNILNMHYGISI